MLNYKKKLKVVELQSACSGYIHSILRIKTHSRNLILAEWWTAESMWPLPRRTESGVQLTLTKKKVCIGTVVWVSKKALYLLS